MEIPVKVMFIYSLEDIQSVQTPLRSWSTIQFGISYISSVLKAHGCQTQLLVLGSNKWKESIKIIKTSIEKFVPRLVCFTAVYSQYSFIEKIARFIKSNWPDKFLLIGGVHAALNPQEVIGGPFDALCIGEGEYPALELCRQLENQYVPEAIANLWIKSPDGSIEKNKPRDFLQDIDILPFPDRQMWKPWMKEQIDNALAVLLGRGCPYNCTYCSNHALRKVAQGKYVRMRSPENILQEIAFLHKNYPYHKEIFFEVESIALDKAWMVELCSQLAAFNSTIHHALSYGCNFRISPQSVDEDLFIAMKKANFHKINIGLESGSERIRREVLKRNYSNDDFLNVVSLARKYGLKIYVFNMIGLPGESLNDHKETILLNRRCQPEGHFTGIFFPYPGTELYNTCIQQGLIQGKPDTQMERKHPIIKLPNFSKTQIQRAYTWFNYHVYKRNKPLWRILIQVITVRMRSNPMTNLLFRKIVQMPILRHLRAKLARI
jgi:radical SAM superfamily enzyme YgiQ (UPF0313 family)